MPLRLYLDDLREIANVITEAGGESTFSTDEYCFKTIDELRDHYTDKNLGALLIQSDRPCRVYIRLRPIFTCVEIGSSKPTAAGMYFKIDTILKKRSLFFGSSSCHTIAGIVLVVIYSILLVCLTRMVHSVSNAGIISSPFFAVLAYLSYLIAFGVPRRRPVVILQPRDEAAGFFKRNKDQLILASISAALGAIFGVVATLLVNHFSK